MLSRSTRQNIAAPDAWSFPLGFKSFAKITGVALFAFDQMVWRRRFARLRITGPVCGETGREEPKRPNRIVE